MTADNLPIGVVEQHNCVIDSYAYERQRPHTHRDIQSDLGDCKEYDCSNQSHGYGHQNDKWLHKGTKLHGHDQIDQHHGRQSDQDEVHYGTLHHLVLACEGDAVSTGQRDDRELLAKPAHGGWDAAIDLSQNGDFTLSV